MPQRQEFSDAVYDAIVARSKRADGLHHCESLTCEVEGGRVVIPGKTGHVDHAVADFLRRRTPKKDRPPLTVRDGRLICIPCHQAKNALEAKIRARLRKNDAGEAAHHACTLAKFGALTEEALAGIVEGLNVSGRKKVAKALERREKPKSKREWPSRPFPNNKRSSGVSRDGTI